MRLPELLTDEHDLLSGPAYDRRVAVTRRLKLLALVTGIVTLVLLVLPNYRHVSKRLDGDWLCIALGVSLTVLTGIDVLNGTVYTRYTGTTKRWEKPRTFWLEIIVQLLLSAGLVIAAIGELLGFWRL